MTASARHHIWNERQQCRMRFAGRVDLLAHFYQPMPRDDHGVLKHQGSSRPTGTRIDAQTIAVCHGLHGDVGNEEFLNVSWVENLRREHIPELHRTPPATLGVIRSVPAARYPVRPCKLYGRAAIADNTTKSHRGLTASLLSFFRLRVTRVAASCDAATLLRREKIAEVASPATASAAKSGPQGVARSLNPFQSQASISRHLSRLVCAISARAAGMPSLSRSAFAVVSP